MVKRVLTLHTLSWNAVLSGLSETPKAFFICSAVVRRDPQYVIDTAAKILAGEKNIFWDVLDDEIALYNSPAKFLSDACMSIFWLGLNYV